VFELMPITDEVRQLILDRMPAGNIRNVATEQGMENLRTDGWRLVLEGKTTVEEVVRVTKDDAGLMSARATARATVQATTAANVAEAAQLV